MKSNSLLTFILALSPFFIQAQSYEFTKSSTPYLELENSISITEGELWDDPEFSIPIGFNFFFFTNNVDTLSSRDGSLIHLDTISIFQGGGVFGDGTGSGFAPTVSWLLSPYLVNIIDRGLVDGESGNSQSTISYLTEGEIGNRIFKMEWKNVGFANELASLETTTSFINYQLWIYEENNSIEYRYGESQIASSSISYSGASGPGVVLADQFNGFSTKEVLSLRGVAANPELYLLQTFDELSYHLLESTPDNGTVYRFDRLTVDTEDIIDLSQNISVYPNPVKELLMIKNNENAAQISSLRIFNTTGQLISTPQNETTIDVSSLPEGIYYLNIQTAEGIAIKRFIKITD